MFHSDISGQTTESRAFGVGNTTETNRDSSFCKMYRKLIRRFLCLFVGPGQPESRGEGERRVTTREILKGQFTLSSASDSIDPTWSGPSGLRAPQSAAGHTNTLARASAPALPM